MKKKLVFIGLGLLVIAIVLFILSGYVLSKGFSKGVNLTNLTVMANGFSYLPITYNGSVSAVAIYAILNNPANLYLLNSSSFSKWYNYMNLNGSAVSGYQYAQHIGINSSYLYKNASLEVIPVNLKAGSNTGNYSGGIYLVIDNTKGSKSSAMQVNASVSYIPLVASTVLVSAALGYAVLILGLAGVILIIWGLLKKDETVRSTEGKGATAGQKEYLNKLYKGVKKGK
jgi:hypothetical protein